MHVSAKDLGTGKEQTVTITSNTNMSKEDIEKAVKEAEQYAEADKKLREETEVKNNADQMIFQTEKTMNELGDKITEQEKADIQPKIDALKEALKNNNIEEIKAKQEELQKAFYEISAKLYQAAQAEQAAQGGAQAGPTVNEDGTVNTDATEVDDNK